MDGKQFKLKPHQVVALKELREKLGEDTSRWAGGKTEAVRLMASDYADLEAAVHVQEFGRSRRAGNKLELAMFGCTTVTMAAAIAHRDFARSIAQHRENTIIWDEVQVKASNIALGTKYPIPLPEQYCRNVRETPLRKEVSGVWIDEAHMLDALPFTSREETPFCRSVRIWDAKGFSPAVELHKRHPSLLVADDWRRVTTFDLYAMAMKSNQDYFYTGMSVERILAIKWWVVFMDDVKHLKFDDVTAPAQLYNDAMYDGRFKFLFNAAFGLDYLRTALVKYLYPMNEGIIVKRGTE